MISNLKPFAFTFFDGAVWLRPTRILVLLDSAVVHLDLDGPHECGIFHTGHLGLSDLVV